MILLGEYAEHIGLDKDFANTEFLSKYSLDKKHTIELKLKVCSLIDELFYFSYLRKEPLNFEISEDERAKQMINDVIDEDRKHDTYNYLVGDGDISESKFLDFYRVYSEAIRRIDYCLREDRAFSFSMIQTLADSEGGYLDFDQAMESDVIDDPKINDFAASGAVKLFPINLETIIFSSVAEPLGSLNDLYIECLAVQLGDKNIINALKDFAFGSTELYSSVYDERYKYLVTKYDIAKNSLSPRIYTVNEDNKLEYINRKQALSLTREFEIARAEGVASSLYQAFLEEIEGKEVSDRYIRKGAYGYEIIDLRSYYAGVIEQKAQELDRQIIERVREACGSDEKRSKLEAPTFANVRRNVSLERY